MRPRNPGLNLNQLVEAINVGTTGVERCDDTTKSARKGLQRMVVGVKGRGGFAEKL